jgi:hypothetical protein
MHAGQIHEDGGNLHAFLGARLNQGVDKPSHLAQVEQVMVKPKQQLIIVLDDVLDGIGNFDHILAP